MTGRDPPPSVIIDTDAGVDDAMALMVAFKAHKAGKINVKAVTATSGNTEVDNVLVNVLRVRKAMDVEKVVDFCACVVSPVEK